MRPAKLNQAASRTFSELEEEPTRITASLLQ